ncbi:MAG: hypothetical protein ACYDCU_13195 [Candidatus Acidiferrales bacterium]
MGLPNRGTDFRNLTKALFTFRNTKDTDRSALFFQKTDPALNDRRFRNICPDRNEASLRIGIGHPFQLLDGHGEYRAIRKLIKPADDPLLACKASVACNSFASAARRFVEDNRNLHTTIFQDSRDGQYAEGKTPSRPGQRCILQHNPTAAPNYAFARDLAQSLRPAVFVPGNPNPREIYSVASQRISQEDAVILNAIGRRVLPPQ